MKTLRLLCLLACASLARAQFAPILTNATLAGSGTHVPSGATLTISSGGTFDFSAGTLVGTLALNRGGTGSATAAGARTNLGLGSIALLNSVDLTSNVTGVLPGANGGTGVANTGKLITVGGNVTFSGAFSFTGNVTANTSLTFPTAGTLATLAGAESLTNKKLGSLTSNGVVQTSGGDGTLSVATVTVGEGGTGLTAGTSGGIPYYSSTSAMTSSAALTANYVILGGGAGAAPFPMGSPGTTTTVLHGNAAGAPTFGAVSLSGDITGTLPVANGGTGQTTYTNGQILIGNTTSGGLDKRTLTPGANVTITNTAGTITIDSTGGGGGGGLSKTFNTQLVSAQSLTSGSDTAISFDTDTWDTDSYWSVSPNPTRITFTSTTAGKYIIQAWCVHATNSTGIRTISVHKNGSAVFNFGSTANAVNGANTSITTTGMILVANGDYLEVFCAQNSGGGLNVTAGINGVLLIP